MKKADIGVALYLLAAVIFFIVPISSNLLDVMLYFRHIDECGGDRIDCSF